MVSEEQLALAKKPVRPLRKLQLMPMDGMVDHSYDVGPFKASVEVKEFHTGTNLNERLKSQAGILDGTTQGAELKAKVSDNGLTLKGRVADANPYSVIDTKEHELQATFFVDYKKLEAKIAPDISRVMDAAIAAARRRVVFEVAKSEAEMKKELKARQPIADMPKFNKNAQADPEQSKALQLKLAQAKKGDLPGSKNSLRQFELALEQSKNSHAVIPAETQKQISDAEAAEKLKAAQNAWPKFPKMPGLPELGSLPKFPALPQAGIPKLPGFPQVSGIPKLPSFPQVSGIPKLPEIPSHASTKSEPPVVPETAQANKIKFPTLPKNNMPGIPSTSIALNTKTPALAAPDIDDAVRKMNEELTKAKLNLPPETNVDAQLSHARDNAQATVKRVQPAMDTVLTYLRHVDAPKTSSSDPVLEPKEDEATVLKWDEWHAKFASMAKDPILRNVSKLENPKGDDTVEITVKADKTLTVKVVKASSTDFDRAILQAYESLNGNAALQFPSGSRRSSVSFQIDNKHTGEGIPSAVKSETATGDNEVVRHHR